MTTPGFPPRCTRWSPPRRRRVSAGLSRALVRPGVRFSEMAQSPAANHSIRCDRDANRMARPLAVPASHPPPQTIPIAATGRGSAQFNRIYPPSRRAPGTRAPAPLASLLSRPLRLGRRIKPYPFLWDLCLPGTTGSQRDSGYPIGVDISHRPGRCCASKFT
jgi:hypothetical protein